MSGLGKIFIALVIALTPLAASGCATSCTPGAPSCFII